MRKLILLFLLAMTVGCAQKGVTVGGVPVEDAVVVRAVNRLYNVETGMNMAGQAALAFRQAGKINDDDWDRIAVLSNQGLAALVEARGVLLEYRRIRSVESAGRLERALTMMDTIGAAFIRLAAAFEDKSTVLGTLRPTGG